MDCHFVKLWQDNADNMQGVSGLPAWRGQVCVWLTLLQKTLRVSLASITRFFM